MKAEDVVSVRLDPHKGWSRCTRTSVLVEELLDLAEYAQCRRPLSDLIEFLQPTSWRAERIKERDVGGEEYVYEYYLCGWRQATDDEEMLIDEAWRKEDGKRKKMKEAKKEADQKAKERKEKAERDQYEVLKKKFGD